MCDQLHKSVRWRLITTTNSKHRPMQLIVYFVHNICKIYFYEIMVKATKRALKSLCSLSDLTMDEFRTFVSRVAVLINCRPLSRINVESQDIILTPNHFLLGSLGGAVEPNDMNWSSKKKVEIHSFFA